MTMQMLAIFFLGAAAVGGVLWVFVYPILSGEQKAENRLASVARPDPAARAAASQRGPQRSRREQVEESLKELEVRQTERAGKSDREREQHAHVEQITEDERAEAEPGAHDHELTFRDAQARLRDAQG